jgi:two-component system, response regulator
MNDTDPIVLIEDNEDDIVLTRRALESNKIGNPLVIARDGAEALELLLGKDGHKLQPAIVLLDLKLPKVDGLTVLKRLREDPRTKLTPIVALTSSTQEQDIVAAYKLHANSYIRKPVDFDQFTEAIRQIGQYWLILNEAPPVNAALLVNEARPAA